MFNKVKIKVFLAAVLIALPGLQETVPAHGAASDEPEYNAVGQLMLPKDYRDWVFLSSGLDMSYSAAPQTGDMHMFENVFVNRSAYDAFLKLGIWPDKTILVTEFRTAVRAGSINKKGRFETDVMGFDVHVKDGNRFSGKWAFFELSPKDTASTMIPKTASCYSCHSNHAAVDTTFVQFYPTLLPIARRFGTITRN